MKEAKEILPNWIVVKRMSKEFDCLASLDKCDMLVAVLEVTDGGCSHAVTIHDGNLIDANEEFALRLSQDSLNY